MNQTQTRSLRKKVLSLILAVVMAVSLLPISAFASGDSKASSDTADSSYKYNIMFLDCGRKYFSVDSIKQIIDNASAAGFNYIQLAVGNDGLRFLLDDMSLTVNGTTYSSDKVSAAIHAGNEAYYNFNVDELTQSEMDTIIAYAASKGMGVIPCVNTPGHMDAILSAATSLTGKDCSYNGSARTIDVTNSTAVAFTQALLQKYITYFAGKGCQLFNMGADEYANDKYKDGAMGFGNLQSTGKYSYYVEYVNTVDEMIQAAGMTAMAFNDGIYFQNDTSDGTFNDDIIICYWSNGWTSYTPMPAADLAAKGFQLINAHGSYYWVLGKSDWQCDASKASGFDYKAFQGGTIDNPVGSMFLIWCDYPGAGTESSVISSTAATIAAFGKTLPEVKKVETVESKTVTKDNVTVTAPGLTDLTVAAATAPAIDAAAEGKVLAYNVTPATANGSYKESGTVTLPIPAGWDTSRVRGFVKNEDGSITTVSGTTSNGKFTFTVPHFSVLGIYELAANAATVKKEINLTVGGTATDTIDGANYENDHTDPDTAIATVTVKGQDEVSSTVKYNRQDISYKTLAGNNSSWTKVKDCYYLVNGNYYPVYAYRYSGYSYMSTYYFIGYSVTDDSNDIETIVDWAYNSTLTVYMKSGTEGTPASTTVSFKGVAVGTTYVTVGNVKYTINVVDKAPDGAMTDKSIKLEYWITNVKVYDADSESTGNQYKMVTSAEANSGDGIEISTIAPNPAYSFFDGTVTVHYWQAMRLDKDNQQTNASGDDETADGTTLTHIRYYGGAWQYKTTDGTWHYFQSDDQLVAYYLQKTEVTKEVDTFAKDWGYGTNSTTPDTSSQKGQVALTVAVVYPDGTVSPAEGDMYKNSTTIFNYWSGRDIGIVAPKNNSDYNISKITVTDGTRDSNTDENVWYTNDSITWKKKTNVAGEKWYDETEVWNKSSGTTPMVNGTDKNIDSSVRMWPAKNTAKLVLIYLEPIEKETNLNVQYIDLNANNHVFHSYQVAMKYNQGDNKPTFTKSLMRGNTVIGDKGPWNSNVNGDANYLPDEAYVTNSSNTKQTFKKDITTIPEINGIYASGLYKYMKADISEDGKTLRLYYDLNATGGKTFVVDFGLPVEIPFSDFGITNVSGVTVSFNEQNTAMTERQGTYGNGKIDMDAETVTYTLTKTLDAKIPIPVYVADKSGKVQMLSVNVIPATSVYYEDSFATFNPGAGVAADAKWSIDKDDTAAKAETNQALSALGAQDIYGYDEAYADSTKLSMGSAHKVTVSADMAKAWTDTSQWPTATFTFKGTGFDVISLTDNNSGAISVKVYSVGNDGTETQVKGTLVNNYYGYTCKDGKWTATPTGDNNALYQIPVIKISGLDYGTYKVVITASYATFADKTGDNQYSFWLDAIRVYDPMGKDNATYEQDNEGYPQYIKLRDELVKGSAQVDGDEKMVFIDGGSTADIQKTYANYGPNNEVYLAKGQAIAFNIPESTNIASIQIGAKAPNGNAAEMNVNGTKTAISSATEMYYQIATQGESFTVTNTGNGLLSLTNLKITFKTNPNTTVTLAALSDEDQANAVAQVRALFAVPVEPFNPDPFTASWGHSVRKGDTATLTVKASEDTAYITVDGETVADGVLRTERTGWGWWAKTVTYREFTYTTTADATVTSTIYAFNDAGVSSDAITATLTVRPSVRDWLHGIIGKWF